MSARYWRLSDYAIITIITLVQETVLGVAKTWKDIVMMLPQKPTMAGLPATRDAGADRASWVNVTAWLVFKHQRRFLAFTADQRAISVWARDIDEVKERYPTLTEVELARAFREYQPDDWAVVLDEAWENSVPLDSTLNEWYNLLNGEKGSTEK